MIIRRKSEGASTGASMLREGKAYVVYAIRLGDSAAFLVYEEEELSVPFFVEEDEVEVLDRSISGSMQYSPRLRSTESHASRPAMLAFRSMAEDRCFYQRLVEGDEGAKKMWNEVKETLDFEAAGRRI